MGPPRPGLPWGAGVMVAVSLPTLMILLIVLGTVVSLPVATILDARQFTPAQWQQAGHNRRTWIAMMAVGIVPFGLVGAAIAVEYLRTVRPKLVLSPG